AHGREVGPGQRLRLQAIRYEPGAGFDVSVILRAELVEPSPERSTILSRGPSTQGRGRRPSAIGRSPDRQPGRRTPTLVAAPARGRVAPAGPGGAPAPHPGRGLSPQRRRPF